MMKSITNTTAVISKLWRKKAKEMARKYDCLFVDNEMPYGRVPQGHPVIVDYSIMRKSGNKEYRKRNK